MTTSIPHDLQSVWEYPLFEALFGRRSRRFGRGFAMTEGPFQYTSPHPPLPLSEIEEALLVAAGVGCSGITLWELSRPLPYRGSTGRTFPSTSGGRRTALFFTNEEGVYVIDPAGPSASRLREIDKGDQRERVLAIYREHRKLIKPGRLDIPRRMPPLSGHDWWDSNGPGSTLFIPVCDVTYSLISLTAQFLDPQLERFARGGRGMHIVDDRHGFRSAGCERWVKTGFLRGDNVLTLSQLERQACYFMFSEPAAICQNMFLATEAMGLGGWKHCGFVSREIFDALGFTMVVPDEMTLVGNPVGIAGVFEAYCPPFFPSMDAAVEAVLRPYAHNAEPTDASTPSAYLMSDAEHRRSTVSVSEEGIACTKAVCNYIYETYARFPGNLDAMHLMWFFQAHHIDTDFYDRFFRPGAYGPTHAAHLAAWHP
ncbi:MAG: hypothetical protein JO084_16785 [Bradyrhizobiaceae bacterium]|nr:hypothetical protein [Hyphomicrobiales bacterium]MBV9429374.1 hypothetical protein [Bradyrhizobiaceae bacterium]